MKHARTIFCVKLSINNHIVGLVHKKHTSIVRTCLMYHAACKVEFQPFKRSYSQLRFSSCYKIKYNKKLGKPIRSKCLEKSVLKHQIPVGQHGAQGIRHPITGSWPNRGAERTRHPTRWELAQAANLPAIHPYS